MFFEPLFCFVVFLILRLLFNPVSYPQSTQSKPFPDFHGFLKVFERFLQDNQFLMGLKKGNRKKQNGKKDFLIHNCPSEWARKPAKVYCTHSF
jgi:hypothetical protein